MKLFTNPRPLPAFLLRAGDQLAVDASTGEPVSDPRTYVDADLTGGIRWVVAGPPTLTGGAVLLSHTTGDMVAPRDRWFIVREAIELDPWTYVHRVDQPDQPPAPRLIPAPRSA